jgi:predicted transcriptional regulator
MNIREIVALLEANAIAGGDHLEEFNVENCFSADLMSDVLAKSHFNGILLTGLTNIQVIRTADIADIRAVFIVRGKNPEQPAVDLARKKGILLFSTKKSLFEASGILYEKGLRAVGK